MKVSANERRQLREALIRTFPSQRDLIVFINDSLGINANQIAKSTSYDQFVSELIEVLASESRLSELIEAMTRANLGNPALDELLETFSSPRLTIRRTPRTGQGYIEPLLKVGNALPLHMVLIPGGTFLMGSPPDEIDRSDSEGPQHTVTVPPFFMGRYPITQAQWRAVAVLPQVDRALDPEPSAFKGENRPVEQVSWYDAVEFCARLKEWTQRPYRLPSEAEWEYACRAGTTTPFYFGKTLTDELANYNASSTYADGPQGEYRRETTPVDHFSIANAFGLSDMHGNVLEWCQDNWHNNYEGAPTDGSAWLTDQEDTSRILRGGSWCSHPQICRSAYRSFPSPDSRYSFIGFRVICSAPRTLQ